MAATANAAERRDALVERLFMDAISAFDLLSVYLGDVLGLYRTLADKGPLTSAELAEAAGIHERYAREWLEQQAASGSTFLIRQLTERYRAPVRVAEKFKRTRRGQQQEVGALHPLVPLLGHGVLPRLGPVHEQVGELGEVAGRLIAHATVPHRRTRRGQLRRCHHDRTSLALPGLQAN
jgi:hypothetical protein